MKNQTHLKTKEQKPAAASPTPPGGKNLRAHLPALLRRFIWKQFLIASFGNLSRDSKTKKKKKKKNDANCFRELQAGLNVRAHLHTIITDPAGQSRESISRSIRFKWNWIEILIDLVRVFSIHQLSIIWLFLFWGLFCASCLVVVALRWPDVVRWFSTFYFSLVATCRVATRVRYALL